MKLENKKITRIILKLGTFNFELLKKGRWWIGSINVDNEWASIIKSYWEMSDHSNRKKSCCWELVSVHSNFALMIAKPFFKN